MKRALKIAGIVVGGLLALFIAAAFVAYLLVDLDKVVNEQVARFKPEIEQKLGRKVEVGKVSTRFLPTLGGSVEALAIAQDPAHAEDDRPLLQIGSIGFEVKLWDALLSGGKKVVVSAVWLDGLKVNLVRYKGGRLSYQDILDRQPGDEAVERADEPSEPLSPEVQAYLKGLSIGQIRLADAEIRLVDFETATGKPAESLIKRLNVRLEDVRLADPIRIKVDAAVFSDATNFSVETSVGPLPADLKIEGVPRIAFVKVRIDDVDLSRVAPYLGPGVPARIDSALFSMHYDLSEVSMEKPFDVEGFLAIRKLQLAGGQPFDLRLDSKLRLDLAALAAQIARLDVAVGQVQIAMSGSLLDLAGAPRFQDFTIRSTTLDPAILLSYYPEAKASLPPGVRLGGPVKVDVKASGDANRQTVKALVDLAALDVLYPGTLLKPAGTPMALRVDGDFTSSDANLRGLNLVLDELDLAVAGTVKNFSKPTLDLTLAAKPFSFDRLARLLPEANKALATAQAKAQGDGRLEGHVKGTLDNVDAALELGLLGVKLDVPGTRLDGDLTLKVAAKGNPEKDLSAEVFFDADKALISVDGALDKKPQTPLHLTLSVDRSGDLIRVKTLDVRLAELALDASGSFDLAKGVTDLRLAMARLDLEKFAKTVVAIPADKAKKGFLDAKLAMRGDPNRLETMELDLSPFTARLGKSDLRGQLKVVDFLAPKVVVKLESELLDVDELMPASEGEAEQPKPEEPAAKAPAADQPELKSYRVDAQVKAKKIVVSGNELTNFNGDVRLADGVARVEDATFSVFGGLITAKGSEAEIWKGRMPFKANLSVKGIDLNSVLSAKTRYKDLLFGKGDFDLKLSGAGFETADLEQYLSGEALAALNEGKLARASLTESVVGDLKPLEKVPGLSLKAIKGENALKAVSAGFKIQDGRMALTRPMTLTVDGNRVVLGGAIGIAGRLFLEGDYFVSPSLVDKLTAGKCKSDKELKVPVSIVGTVDAPEFKPNGAAVATALAERCLAGAAGQALNAAIKDQLGVDVPADKAAAEARARAEAEKAKAELEKARAEAEEKARAEADKAKAAAEAKLAEEKAKLEQAKLEAERRAREEAEKKKKEAEDLAKQKAKEAAGKALPGLFK